MGSITIESLKNNLKERGWICPEGIYWSDLVKKLKENNHTNLEIKNPLILGGSGASDKEKYDRFMHHLDIADKLSLLPQIKYYLDSLDDASFLNSEEIKLGKPINNTGYRDLLNDDLEEVRQTILPALDILKKIQKVRSEINDEDKLYDLFIDNGWFDDKIQRGENYLMDLLTDLLDIYHKQERLIEGIGDLESFCSEIFYIIDENKDF